MICPYCAVDTDKLYFCNVVSEEVCIDCRNENEERSQYNDYLLRRSHEYDDYCEQENLIDKHNNIL